MTALCSGKICTIFPEKGALNPWKACTIALEYSTKATLSKHLRFLEGRLSEKTMVSIWNATLITLYLNYEVTEDFQTQFQKNSDMLLSLIEKLRTADAPMPKKI